MTIYIKNQLGYLILLFAIFVIPLGCFFQFSKYPLPKIQYFDLAFLLIFQYAFYNEKNYRKKMEPKITAQLRKELSRTPSLIEINERSSLVVQGRGVTLVLTIIGVLFLMVYYRQF